MDVQKIAFLASEKPDAAKGVQDLIARYGDCPPEEADVICPVGGDGFMLQTLREYMSAKACFYGINRGTVGFLMNEFLLDDLPTRIASAERAGIHPLEMTASTVSGEVFSALAINDISMFRETRQTAHIRISIDGKVRMDKLVCDGVLLATPAGSTAYNLSAHGPILPIDAHLLALTPISAFRPRRWRGALLPRHAKVVFEALSPEFRPVSAVADNYEVRNVVRAEVREDRSRRMTVLFDKGHSLEERILQEQFAV
ncbi:MAG: NAD kinase [Pseudomonadota bacterium]